MTTGVRHNLQSAALLLVPGPSVFLVASEDTGDLQTSAKGLVEQHPGLEFGHEREPGEEGNGREQEKSHQDLVAPGKSLDRPPQPDLLNHRPDSLGNLQHNATKNN